MVTNRWGNFLSNWIKKRILNYILFKKKNIKKGFTEHVISTSSEWILTCLQMLFLLTFYSDFKRIKISYPEIHDPFIRSSNSIEIN